MSYELYVDSFLGGEPAGFPAEILRHVFAAHIRVTETEPNGYQLQKAGASSSAPAACTLFVDTQASLVESFSIHRPTGDLWLYEACLQLLRLPGLVLYAPGDCPPLIGHPETAEHLPADMVESMGPATLVSSAEEMVGLLYPTA